MFVPSEKYWKRYLELTREAISPNTTNTERRIRFWNSVWKIIFRYADLLRECEKMGVIDNLKPHLLTLEEPLEYLAESSGKDRFELLQFISVAKSIMDRAPANSESANTESEA